MEGMMDFLKENFYMVVFVLLFLLGIGIAIFLELMFLLFEKLTSKREKKDEEEVL